MSPHAFSLKKEAVAVYLNHFLPVVILHISLNYAAVSNYYFDVPDLFLVVVALVIFPNLRSSWPLSN